MSFHGLTPRGITNSEQRELTFPAYQLMQGNTKVLIYLYNNSLNYRNQFHCAERKKSKVSKITNVSASSGPGIQAILPGFGIFFLSVINEKWVRCPGKQDNVCEFLEVWPIWYVGMFRLWTPRLSCPFLLHTQGRPGISFVSTILLLPYFHQNLSC